MLRWFAWEVSQRKPEWEPSKTRLKFKLWWPAFSRTSNNQSVLCLRKPISYINLQSHVVLVRTTIVTAPSLIIVTIVHPYRPSSLTMTIDWLPHTSLCSLVSSIVLELSNKSVEECRNVMQGSADRMRSLSGCGNWFSRMWQSLEFTLSLGALHHEPWQTAELLFDISTDFSSQV